jgi:hypothetical protein
MTLGPGSWCLPVADDIGQAVPWHIWLLVIRAKLSYKWSTFWGPGQPF